ncbi:MAG: hypothetical protein HYV93_09540 [Candidatus Rokubacteria bacterium]|nr:hypothetical protein [Candidatus Rokubacteria bacterium]
MSDFNENVHQVSAEVERLISRHAPAAWSAGDRLAGLPLGDGGIGLDSLAMVDLLIACERTFQIQFSEEFLNRGTLTVSELIAEVARCREQVALPGRGPLEPPVGHARQQDGSSPG